MNIGKTVTIECKEKDNILIDVNDNSSNHGV